VRIFFLQVRASRGAGEEVVHDYAKLKARDGILGGLPMKAIAGLTLLHPIRAKNKMRTGPCLFNIAHRSKYED